MGSPIVGGGPGGTGVGFDVEVLVSVACGAMCGVELLSDGGSDACGSGAFVGVGVGAVGNVVLVAVCPAVIVVGLMDGLAAAGGFLKADCGPMNSAGGPAVGDCVGVV